MLQAAVGSMVSYRHSQHILAATGLKQRQLKCTRECTLASVSHGSTTPRVVAWTQHNQQLRLPYSQLPWAHPNMMFPVLTSSTRNHSACVVQGGIGPQAWHQRTLHVLDFTDFERPRWHSDAERCLFSLIPLSAIMCFTARLLQGCEVQW